MIRGRVHLRPHPCRGAGVCGAPASTTARNELVFGDPHRHRGKVEHLPPLHAHFRRVGDVATTSTAAAGLVPHNLVRISDLGQDRSRMALLPTRLTLSLAAKRLRSRFTQPVRRRRLRRVPRVLPQPALQLDNLSLQLLDPLSLPRHQSSTLLTDKVSGKLARRPERDKCLNYPRRGQAGRHPPILDGSLGAAPHRDRVR